MFTVEIDKEQPRNFTLTQEPSVLSIIAPPLIPKKGGSVTSSITATPGLTWRITETSNGITVSPTEGDGTTVLTFSAADNPKCVRIGTFIVSVTGTNPERTTQIKIEQLGANIIQINQALVKEFTNKNSDTNRYQLFNYDNALVSTPGSDRPGYSSYPVKTGAPYTIEVSKNQPTGPFGYAAAIKQCPLGWRIPTMIELFAMHKNRAILHAISDFAKMGNTFYWSSSVYNKTPTLRCGITYNSSSVASQNFSYTSTPSGSGLVRCVREVTP